MAIEVVVPRLGWSMDEGTFGEWLKRDGEIVRAGEMLFVLEGDKASQEIESFDSGILRIPPDAPAPGDTVAVGQLLAYLVAEGEALPAGAAQPAAAEAPAAMAADGPPPAAGEAAAAATSTTSAPRAGRRVAVTPRARRRARELGVDWARVPGTGRFGRVRERDVVAYARRDGGARGQQAPLAAPGRLQPASRIRRTIAQRMLAAVQQTAPVTLTTKADASRLVALRAAWQSQPAADAAPGYNDMLVKLTAAALPECPALNARWQDEGIFLYDQVHMALAVDTPAGLVAPVIRNVQSMSLVEIAAQTRAAVERARGGKLHPDQLTGGTFTITNLGMFDVDFFTPIINLPQTAILGVGRVAAEPVVVDEQVVAGRTLALSLTFDHRVVDGGPAARWLQHLRRMIEQPDRWLF